MRKFILATEVGGFLFAGKGKESDNRVVEIILPVAEKVCDSVEYRPGDLLVRARTTNPAGKGKAMSRDPLEQKIEFIDACLNVGHAAAAIAIMACLPVGR